MAHLISLLLIFVGVGLSAGTAGGGTGRDPYYQEALNNNPFEMTTSAANNRCDNGRRCLNSVARCTGGQCVCKDGKAWGSGDFACYNENALAVEINNDPWFASWSKDGYHFPYPCRYLVTHFTNDLVNRRGEKIGRCQLKVYGFNARKKGKIFLLGFDTAVQLKYDDGTTKGRSTRNYGVLRGNNPTVFSQTSYGYRPNGEWTNKNFHYWDSTNGVRLRLHQNVPNRQIIIDAEQCGVRMTFVPYDVKNMQASGRVPGLSLAVEDGFNTEWLSPNVAMSFAPTWGEAAFVRDYKKKDMTISESMVFRAFTRNIEQNHPWGAKEECEALRPALQQCDNWRERFRAMKACSWMFRSVRFMRCYDNQYSSKRLLELFEKCVTMHCGTTSCSDVQDMIRQQGCDSLKQAGRLWKFMKGDFCPNSWNLTLVRDRE